MKQYTKESKKIVKELIQKSFPKLKRKIIFITGIKIQFDPKIFATINYLGFMVWIIIFPLSKTCSREELKSILAHELSHYEILLKKSFKERLFFVFKLIFSRKARAVHEIETDKYSIKKGYGKGRYTQVKKIEKENDKKRLAWRKKSGYLSSNQIKSYAKKIGKW